ncbi:MAG: tRNA (adenosine(37)-N6)-dimethylallyltransferase MiaA [Alphaproteobacteria bacterium]
MISPSIFIIQGPTASGKSALSIDLAQAFQGCIINADSMQLYRGLPILSAQPSDEDKRKAPHKLYGILDPTEQCSASRWTAWVHEILEKENFKTFILVGGTGFYIKSFLQGLSPIPDVPATIRKSLQDLVDTQGKNALYAQLQERDPVMAKKLIPQDTQRVMRALEIILFTKKSLAEWQKEKSDKALNIPSLMINLMPPRELLYEKINQRVIHMLEQGALDEVRILWERGLSYPTCSKTLGYQELESHLEGKISLDQAVEKIQQKSRNYAKRQLTWLRHQTNPSLVWEQLYEPKDWKKLSLILPERLQEQNI